MARMYRRWVMNSTFLDYECRSCLKCSSVRNRIDCRNCLSQSGIQSSILLRQNGRNEYIDGRIWLDEKTRYLINESSYDEAREQYEIDIEVVERRQNANIEGQAEEGQLIAGQREARAMSENELAEWSQLDIASEHENEQQIVISFIHLYSNADPNLRKVVYDGEREIRRSLRKLLNHINRKREPPPHLKCRMFLNELIGRHIDRPMREIDLIALIDKAIPNCLDIDTLKFLFIVLCSLYS